MPGIWASTRERWATNWVNKAKNDGAFKEKPLEVNERARLKELEQENRKLKMERDLLKKAAAWFASQSQ